MYYIVGGFRGRKLSRILCHLWEFFPRFGDITPTYICDLAFHEYFSTNGSRPTDLQQFSSFYISSMSLLYFQNNFYYISLILWIINQTGEGIHFLQRLLRVKTWSQHSINLLIWSHEDALPLCPPRYPLFRVHLNNRFIAIASSTQLLTPAWEIGTGVCCIVECHSYAPPPLTHKPPCTSISSSSCIGSFVLCISPPPW